MKESQETFEAFGERLILARSRLLRREPFLGFVALELPTHILTNEDAPTLTAATDGGHFLTIPPVPSTNGSRIGFCYRARNRTRRFFSHAPPLWSPNYTGTLRVISPLMVLIGSCEEGGYFGRVVATLFKTNLKTGIPEHIACGMSGIRLTAERIYEELE
jgi:hypothetical protein